jgi:hypothetical protein
MKIINKTPDDIYYEVTSSGLDIRFPVTSGTVPASGILKFDVDAGEKPYVYIKNNDSSSQGCLKLQVTGSDSSVLLSMTEVDE